MKVLFLILVLMSSFAYAQNPAEIKAEKVNELGYTTTEHLEATIDVFYQKNLQNNPTAKGFIVNYGKEREIFRNEKIIKELFSKRNYGISEFTLINGGFLDEIKTEIWLVPEGAEPPEILLKPRLFDEFGKISQKEVKLKAQKLRGKFLERESRDNGLVAYLIFYTDDKVKTSRDIEKLIVDVLLDNCRDCYGFGNNPFVFIEGGKLKEQKTQFWIVPRGAEPPTP